MKKYAVILLLAFSMTGLFGYPDPQTARDTLKGINQKLLEEREQARKSLEALEDFFDWLEDLFNWGNENSRIFIISFVSVLALVVAVSAVLIVLRLKSRAKKAAPQAKAPAAEADILPSSDILAAAYSAAEAGSFSEAIILLYLDSLRHFPIKNHSSLTNADLLSRLTDREMRDSFGVLAGHEEKISFAILNASESDFEEARLCADRLRSAVRP